MRYLSLLALPLLLPACNNRIDQVGDCSRVETKQSANAPFESYGTYAILTGDDVPPDVQLDIPSDVETNLGKVNQQIRRNMDALGFTEVDPDAEAPDLWAFNLFFTDTETTIEWVCNGGYWWGWWGWGWDPCAFYDPIQIEYTVGTVVIGLADPDIDQVVFGGVLEEVLDCPGDLDTRLRDGVDEIFDDYP